MVSRRHIPRGCRTNYIPGLTGESQSIYEAYKKQYSSNPYAEGTLETGNKLIDTMKEEKKKRWEEVITLIDLTHNNRKAWQTIKKLSYLSKPSVSGKLQPGFTPSARQWPRNNANKA